MKSTSHFAMAHLIYTALQDKGVLLSRTAFAYGNIAPDYIPTLVLTPHFGRVCTRNIEELSRGLSSLPLNGTGRVGAEYSKQLGMICHYVCDYFCLAHNKDFTGGVRQHMNFENALDMHLRGNWRSLLALEASDDLSRCREVSRLMSALEGEKAEYVAGGYSFDDDLGYAFRACVGLILALTAISQRCFDGEGERLAFSYKAFAEGRGYVFRMFFYKNRNNNIFFMPELMSPILL